MQPSAAHLNLLPHTLVLGCLVVAGLELRDYLRLHSPPKSGSSRSRVC